MNTSLIICTYQRPHALMNLIRSIKIQTQIPQQIIIVDSSLDDKTHKLIPEITGLPIEYYKVGDEHRGLTRQRNFGIAKIAKEIEIVCFLDDDTVLSNTYFEEVLKAFAKSDKITGVGGVASNENRWVKSDRKQSSTKFYVLDGYERKESARFYLRNLLGLQSPFLPYVMPDFSHGRTYGYPPTAKIYEVDLLIGMSMAFKRRVIENEKFSDYFVGYGLYEDADYSLRALKYGKNVINTAAQLEHHHDPSGRPDMFKYGKMVVRNGWYVWRVKYPRPSIKARLKWNATALLLTLIRYSNIFTTSQKSKALKEALGRTYAFCTLIFNKPRISNRNL